MLVDESFLVFLFDFFGLKLIEIHDCDEFLMWNFSKFAVEGENSTKLRINITEIHCSSIHKMLKVLINFTDVTFLVPSIRKTPNL